MESDEVKFFRINLRTICNVRGTMRRICRESGVSSGYLYKVMRGESAPSVDVAAKVCRAAGIPLREMFSAIGGENFSEPD